MTRRPQVDGDRLWEIVAATVRPLRSRHRPRGSLVAAVPPPASPRVAPPTATPPPVFRRGAPAPVTGVKAAKPKLKMDQARPIEAIEPGRRRRLHRDRDEHGDWLDLHGLTQDQARAALTGFVLRAWADRQRHVLIITGKGNLGDGVLRRRVPEWLGEPPLRKVVAGLSEAHRRHGGEGALHVALKRAEGS